MMVYKPPVVIDYGTLEQITESTGLNGPEDGGMKAIPTHHTPVPVSGPSFP